MQVELECLTESSLIFILKLLVKKAEDAQYS